MEVTQEVGHQLSTELDMASSLIELEFLDLSQLRQVPVRDAAFAARNQEMNRAIILQWTDPAKDRDFLAWGEKIQAKFEGQLRLAGHQPDKLMSSFLNYTQENKATPTDMFGANAGRLMDIKKKYDPGNVFNKLNPLY